MACIKMLTLWKSALMTRATLNQRIKGIPPLISNSSLSRQDMLKGINEGDVSARLACMSLTAYCSLISHLFVGVGMGAALKQIASWLMSIPHFGGIWLHYTRCVTKFSCWLN